MAIIIAGGVPDELTATLARVAVQVRQPLLDRLCAGQAIPTSASPCSGAAHKSTK